MSGVNYIDVLDAFVKSEDVGILEQIAKRSNATPELLRKVANNPHADAFEVQKALVKNSEIPEDVLEKLAKSKEPEILWAIAKLKNYSVSSESPPRFKASANVLRKLANNPVANDPKIQDKYLKNLSIQIAANHNTPEDILKKLAGSTNYDVLLLVTENANASESVMERVGENSITWKESSIQISLASKTNIPRKLMQKLANSDDGNVLLALSKNSALPSELKNLVIERLHQYTNDLKIETPQPIDISDNPFAENKKLNCSGKHFRNNLLGVAAAGVGFLVGGPVGALAAYGTVTGSLESATTLSGCQF